MSIAHFLIVLLSCLAIILEVKTDPCPPEYQKFCEECDIDEKCVVCNPAFYLDSGFCLSCPSHCADCKNGTSCDKCMTNYELAPSTQCVRLKCADDRCLDCPQNLTVCSECRDGYSLDKNGHCYLGEFFYLLIGCGVLITTTIWITVCIVQKCNSNSRHRRDYSEVLDHDIKNSLQSHNLNNVESIGYMPQGEISGVIEVKESAGSGASYLARTLLPQLQENEQPDHEVQPLPKLSVKNKRRKLN